MKILTLTLGLFALVDDEDYESLRRFDWCAYRGRNTFYASRKVPRPGGGTQIHLKMHREILGLTDPVVKVDHKDGDGLDNRRRNLRAATTAQNCANGRKSLLTLNPYKGAHWHRKRGVWHARLRHGPRVLYLGTFQDPESAARAYDRKAKELFGAFAHCNFQT